MEKLDGGIFEGTYLLEETDPDSLELERLVQMYPSYAFGVLNRLFNAKGLCLSIGNQNLNILLVHKDNGRHTPEEA